MERPTGPSSHSSNFRALIDLHVKDKLPNEVKQGLANLFVTFHQEVNASVVLGLEHLIINISNLLPSSNNSSGISCTNETVPTNDEMRTKPPSDSATERLGNCDQYFSKNQPSSVAAASEKEPHTDLIHQGDGEHGDKDKLPNTSASRSPNVFLQSAHQLLISQDVPMKKRRRLYDIKDCACNDQGSLSDKSLHLCIDPCAQHSLLAGNEIAEVNDISVAPQVHTVQTVPEAGTSNVVVSVYNGQDQREEDHFVRPLDYVCSHVQASTGNLRQRNFTIDPRLRALYDYSPPFDLGIDLGDEEPSDKNTGKSKAADNGYAASYVPSNFAHAGPSSTTANRAPTIDVSSDDDVQLIGTSSKQPEQHTTHFSEADFGKSCHGLCIEAENIYNKENCFVREGIGNVPQHGNQLTHPTTSHVLQPMDVNVLQSGYRGGTVASTCQLPVYGQRRQVTPSRFTCSPFITDHNACNISDDEIVYYETALSMANSEQRSQKAFSMPPEEKSFVTFSCLAYSMKPEGKVDNFLMNSFIRILYEDYHPVKTKSGKHCFFSSVGQHLLKDESQYLKALITWLSPKAQD